MLKEENKILKCNFLVSVCKFLAVLIFFEFRLVLLGLAWAGVIQKDEAVKQKLNVCINFVNIVIKFLMR